MRFILSHSSSHIPDILQDGYIKSSIKTNILGLTGEQCEYIYFELLSKSMHRTAPGVQMYFSIALLCDFQAYFTSSWIFEPLKEGHTIIDKKHVMKSLYKCEKESIEKTEFCNGFGNQIAIKANAIPIYKYLIGIRDPLKIDMNHYWIFCDDKVKEYEQFFLGSSKKLIY